MPLGFVTLKGSYAPEMSMFNYKVIWVSSLLYPCQGWGISEFGVPWSMQVSEHCRSYDKSGRSWMGTTGWGHTRTQPKKFSLSVNTAKKRMGYES